MKKLHISEELSLPIQVVTEKLGWLGVTGSGKTYGASKLAELMWDAGAQFIVLDVVGVWYGLRLAKDGKTPSDITIPIFGGLHGDVPLEPTAGALMADLIVDRGISAILDVSQFEYDTDKARFGHDFAARFFFRKKAAPSAVHLFLEECQEFCPQNPQKGEERMLHAFTRLQKLGRNFGIGSSYISQRPQDVSKKALNMAQTLFVFRTTGSQERAAIEKWIEDKALDQDIANDLPKIPTGQCHAWSPEFLKISETVRISEKRTFNASSTPEVGARAVARHLAPIDLEKIATDMAATIEKAKDADPEEWKKKFNAEKRRVAELEKQLAKPAPATKEKAVDPEKLKATAQKMADRALAKALRPVRDALRRAEKLINDSHLALAAAGEFILKQIDVTQEIEKAGAQVEVIESNVRVAFQPPVRKRAENIPRSIPSRNPQPSKAIASESASGDSEIKPVHQRILDALAELEAIGARSPERALVAFTAGYSHTNSTGFAKAISSLSTWGMIHYPTGGVIALTETGRAAARQPDVPVTVEEVQQRIASILKPVHAKVLQPLIDNYPEDLTREELAEKSGYGHVNSTGFAKALSQLSSLGFARYPVKGRVAAAPVLFLEGQ